MDANKLIELLFYCIPALITGLIAYYFFSLHTKNEEGRRRYLLQKESQKDALPLRLAAFERMVLFLERINPTKLLIRVTPLSSDKFEYENYVTEQIDQEFEHNLTQQIYMSDAAWTVIVAAKNATIQTIRNAAMNEQVDSADKLRAFILSDLLEKQTPSSAALSFLKNEINEFL
jgi:hypothetical protein